MGLTIKKEQPFRNKIVVSSTSKKNLSLLKINHFMALFTFLLFIWQEN
jgi:hypothetical protein